MKNRKTWLRNRICGRFAKIKKARKERIMREVAHGKTLCIRGLEYKYNIFLRLKRTVQNTQQKKFKDFPVPSRDVTNQTLPERE